jgi:hypothetical protein
MADSDTGLVFVIDGADYPWPDLETFDMAERRVMYDLSGIVEEDFVRQEDETEDEHDERVRKMARHPGFMEAAMHIAYARGNPELKRAKVQAIIDHTNYQEAIAKWADLEEDGEDGPPVSEPTSEPNSRSLSGSDGSNASSGIGSPTSSDAPGKTPGSTGTSASDTSATSARSLSAV